MGESRRRKLLDPNYGRNFIDPTCKNVVDKHFRNKTLPRGFFESPTDEAIKLWLKDTDLRKWLVQKTGWTDSRTMSLIVGLYEKILEDKVNNTNMFDTWHNCPTIGVNTGTWTLHVWIPSLFAENRNKFVMGQLSEAELDIIAPDWHKTAFDF